jgi:type II secretory pathway pseudopilin PulG
MVEVMVSVVVLAIAIAPAFDAMLRGRLLVAHRGEERIALRLIERKLEQFLGVSYESAGSDADVQSVNLTAGTHPSNPLILLVTRGDDDPSNDVYGDLTWTVTPIVWTDPGGVYDDANYKEIVVKLAWPTGAHRDSVVVTTITGGP